MLGLLGNILEVFENIPAYILYAAETFINGIFTVIEAGVTAISAILPSIPELSPPPFLPEINWFFPIGSILGVITTMVAAFIVWLSIRWLFQKVGEL